MIIKNIEAKSILRKHKRIDSWFVARYGMNLYRGCQHACAYCDGRAEKYQVQGDFGREILVKANAPAVLRKELDPARKRVPLKPSPIILGGGVGDSYQQVDKETRLSRQMLEIILEYGYPVHVLTKSTLVLRDIDLLKKINEKTQAIVSMSFSSVNQDICSVFEPGVPLPDQRLKTLATIKNEGIPIGIFLMPVIPFISDTVQEMEATIRAAAQTGVDFIVFSAMTLKGGRQKQHFQGVLNEYNDQLHIEYENIYQNSPWGAPTSDYYKSIHETFIPLMKKYKILPRIPQSLYNRLLSENDLITVILDQIDYLLKLKEQNTPYGYAAHSIAKLKHSIREMGSNLRSISGVGPVTERIIKEILNTGQSRYLAKLMAEYQ